MAYIEKYGLKFHWDFKFLPKKFLGITLFGHVFFTKSKSSLTRYLNTAKGREFANHEAIHCAQAASFKADKSGNATTKGWLIFYVKYLLFWLKNLIKHPTTAYHSIPFEKEAYENQSNLDYVSNVGTNWKAYL